MLHLFALRTRAAGGEVSQGALFLRPCFQIVLHGSGREARIGVRVLAAPAPDGGS